MLESAYLSRKDRWMLRGLHFLIWAAAGFLFPFLNVYYRHIGLSGVQIGLIGMLASLLSAFSTAIWGMLNDRFHKTRLLFALAGMGVIGMAFILPRVTTFWLILPVAGSFTLFNAPLFSLLNSATLALLGKRAADFGLYRVWGTIGFIVTCWFSGPLFERLGQRSMFPAFAITMALFVALAIKLPAAPVQPQRPSRVGVGRMIQQRSWVIFMGSVFCLWVAFTGSGSFLGVVIKEMGGRDSLIGWSSIVAAAAEIVPLFASSRLLQRFGPQRMTEFSLVFFIIRMGLYAVMPVPEWVMAINILQGITYIPFLIGSVAYANELAPAELRNTSQGLLAAVMNVANLVGVLVSGWLFDYVGPARLYACLAGVCFLGLLIFESQRMTKKP